MKWNKWKIIPWILSSHFSHENTFKRFQFSISFIDFFPRPNCFWFQTRQTKGGEAMKMKNRKISTIERNLYLIDRQFNKWWAFLLQRNTHYLLPQQINEFFVNWEESEKSPRAKPEPMKENQPIIWFVPIITSIVSIFM